MSDLQIIQQSLDDGIVLELKDYIEVVTYRISDGYSTYNVTHWGPENYTYLVRISVCLYS